MLKECNKDIIHDIKNFNIFYNDNSPNNMQYKKYQEYLLNHYSKKVKQAIIMIH